MAKKKAKRESKAVSFESSLGKLEDAVRALESGDLGLDEALKRYEEGVQHLRQCHEALREAESRIEMLTQVDADGQVTSTPFEAGEDASLEEKQAKRAQRRGGEGPELF